MLWQLSLREPPHLWKVQTVSEKLGTGERRERADSSCCCRVVYCSSECQKKDWTAGHKAFCSKWVKASATFGPSPALVPQYPPRSSQLTAIVNNLNALVSKNMGIFGMDFIAMNCTMHQPRCMCCYGVESAERKLVKCPVCLLFAWCADGDCEDKCRQQHVEEGLCDVIKETVTDEEVVRFVVGLLSYRALQVC